MASTPYVLAGQAGELDRLQLQSRVWEPAGRRLLQEIGDGSGLRVLDVGCGAMGWLRLLSEWVGADGSVVGTDIDEAMLSAADAIVRDEGVGNVALIQDDLFDTDLEPGSFDLVHARFQLAPLGRGSEQMATYLRLVRPGGTIVLEDVDVGSWRFLPPAPALERLIPLLADAFAAAGGDPTAPTTTHLQVFRDAGVTPHVRAEVQALPPEHPYLRLPLQQAAGLDGLLRRLAGDEEVQRLVAQAETELQDPGRWGLTFTLVQTWGTAPA